MTQLTMDISGMTCGHCVAAVRRALDAVSGVTVDTVAIGSATVTFDPSLTTRDHVAQAVEDEGYRVSSTTGPYET